MVFLPVVLSSQILTGILAFEVEVVSPLLGEKTIDLS
jgi:hypothetical protein